MSTHKCDSCLSSSDRKLLKCGACRTVRYCNAECQKQDWQHHRKQCRIVSKGLETGSILVKQKEVQKTNDRLVDLLIPQPESGIVYTIDPVELKVYQRPATQHMSKYIPISKISKRYLDSRVEDVKDGKLKSLVIIAGEPISVIPIKNL